MRWANLVHILCCSSAFVPSVASAMNWPNEIVCTDTISQTCEDGGACRPLQGNEIAKALWTFDLKGKAFKISDVFEDKEVPNFSGAILYQHDRAQNTDYMLLTILLDTDQMVTFSPKLGPDRSPSGVAFWGVMQFAQPGATTTLWTTCEAGGNGS